GPDCMNSMLARIAADPTTATTNPTASRALQPSHCRTPGRTSASSSRRAPERPARIASLCTFLHPHVRYVFRTRRHQSLDLAGFVHARSAIERQPDGRDGAFPKPAYDPQFAAVQRQQSLHDRQPESGPVVAPVVRGACLEERLADARHVVGVDAEAGILHA